MRVTVDFAGWDRVPEAFRLPDGADAALSDVFAEILAQHAASFGLPECVEVSVGILAPDEIAELNVQYRQVEGPTDVLSFPLWEEKGRFTPPEGWEELPLGDILVCYEEVQRNADERGASFRDELALVLVHGLLHLLAWDHDTEEREREMWRVQEAFRDRLVSLWERAPGQEGA